MQPHSPKSGRCNVVTAAESREWEFGIPQKMGRDLGDYISRLETRLKAIMGRKKF